MSSSKPAPVPTVNPIWRDWDTCELYKYAYGVQWWQRAGPIRVLMLGLDAAGKSTIIWKLFGEPETSIPTIGIGFNVETTKVGTTVCDHAVETLVWDVGGRDKIRPLWRHYFQTVQGLIWVMDSNDRDRLANPDYDQSALHEFYKLVAEDELRGRPILILANKQDLPDAMRPHEIAALLELPVNTGGDMPVPASIDNKSYVGRGRKELSAKLDVVLADALPVAPLRAIVLSYCTFDSSYVRIVGCSASTDSPAELRAGYEWLIQAVYQRAGKVWDTKPPSRGICTIM